MKLYLQRLLILLSLAAFLNACAVPEGRIPSETAFQETPELLVEDQPIDVFTALIKESPTPTSLLPDATHTPTVNPSVGITVWHGFSDTKVLALNEIVENFHLVEPGVQVDLVYVPYDDLLDRYINTVTAGSGPSIMLGTGEWGSLLFDAEVIADLTGEVPGELQMEISPPALEAVSYRGAVVGLPYALRGVVMLRNYELIHEAPKTYDDLIRLSHDATRGQVVGAYLERGDLFAFPQLAACGGFLNYPNGYPVFDKAIGICWFELLKSFEAAGPVSFNTDDDLNRFLNGKVGLIFEGTWNLALISEALGEKLVIDAWPEINGNPLSGYVWTDNLYLNANLSDDTKDAALGFSQFLLSPDSQSIFSEFGQIPATLYRDVQERLIYQSAAALSRGVPYPVNPETKFFWDAMHEALVSVFENGVDPDTATQNALDKINENVETIWEVDGDSEAPATNP